MSTTLDLDDDLLIRFLTEDVSPEEAMQVEHWCTLSEENQKTLEQVYFALHASNCLKLIKSVDSNRSLLRLKENIRQKNRTQRRKYFIHHLQRVAAVLFLPVFFLSVWLWIQDEKTTPVQYIEVQSNPGMVSSFNLPDGSLVWLNGGSRLRYPNIFNGDYREVEMSGQGYFEVKHNAAKPFLVKTDENFSLEVLGTSFNLTAYNDEDVIEATLVEGSVKLHLEQNGGMVQKQMHPDEKATYFKNSQTLSVETVNSEHEIAWKDNRLIFKGHSMEQVVRSLSRYYNVRFVVKNNQVMNSEITAKFHHDQLPQVMEYLKIASGVRYRIIPGKVENNTLNPTVVEIWK